MAAPTHDSAPGLAGHSRHRVLTWLMMFFGIPVPLGIVVAFVPQLRRIGEVSHWPWGDYGFFGWWLVPLSFAVAAVCGPGLARVSLVAVASECSPSWRS